MMLEHVLKLSLRFVVNGQRSPRMTSESLLVRCVAGTLSVCGLTEVIHVPLNKHSVTFENDPFPVPLHVTKCVLNLNV